jgi:hypothetical protein
VHVFLELAVVENDACVKMHVKLHFSRSRSIYARVLVAAGTCGIVKKAHAISLAHDATQGGRKTHVHMSLSLLS